MQQQQPTTHEPAQAPAPAPSEGISVPVPVSQASHLLTSFTHFLTVCIHNILYYRNLYPAQTFLTSRAYNLPVHQSRHPRVCAWVRDAVDALRAQLVRGAAERLAVVIYDARHDAVVERWMFDVASFPAGWSGLGEDSGRAPDDDDDEDDESDRRVAGDVGGGGSKVNWSNVHEELRAAIRKLAYAGEKMAPLPDGCTFTVAVELREEGEPPIGHPQPWIPTQSTPQTGSRRDRRSPGKGGGGGGGGAKTTPLRAVEAGPLFFECWVEEGPRAKGTASSAPAPVIGPVVNP